MNSINKREQFNSPQQSKYESQNFILFDIKLKEIKTTPFLAATHRLLSYLLMYLYWKVATSGDTSDTKRVATAAGWGRRLPSAQRSSAADRRPRYDSSGRCVICPRLTIGKKTRRHGIHKYYYPSLTKRVMFVASISVIISYLKSNITFYC